MTLQSATQVEVPAQASLLDVVCNFVAILIVLVMIGAVYAKRGTAPAATPQPVAAAIDNGPLEEETKSAESTAGGSGGEYQRASTRSSITRKWPPRCAKKSAIGFKSWSMSPSSDWPNIEISCPRTKKRGTTCRRELVASKSELESLSTTQVSITKPKPHVLEHLPTPMARTVFGNEIHFRLLNHRLAYVPWDEVIEEVKHDIRNHLSKLRDNARVEALGPRGRGLWGQIHPAEGRSRCRAAQRHGPPRHDRVGADLLRRC